MLQSLKLCILKITRCIFDQKPSIDLHFWGYAHVEIVPLDDQAHNAPKSLLNEQFNATFACQACNGK